MNNDDDFIIACQNEIDQFGTLSPSACKLLLQKYIDATTPDDRVFAANSPQN